MKTTPKIMKYMTGMPHTIGYDIPIKKAVEIMREGGFRHLPVYDAGKLVGVITDRDIKLAASFTGSAELKVGDVMTPDAYTVGVDTPLDTVVSEMAEHKYGCTLIKQDNGKIVGIFTTVDAMRVLAEILHMNYKD